MLFIDAGLAAYFIACVLYFVHSAFKNRLAGKLAFSSMVIAFLANSGAVISRWYSAGRPPLSNLHEVLIFFAWSLTLVYLVMETVLKFKFLGAFSAMLSIFALTYASLLDTSIKPLLPALRSNWLVVHVVSYFIGYGAAAIASLSSAVYLGAPSRNGDISLRQKMDAVSYPLILFAFPFLTIGLTTGAVWANRAWGSYWSWDPKETWSLITWLIYAGYLHLRIVKGWQGKKMAYLSVTGFVAILFTFLGVNVFFGGLHSYR